MMLDIIYPVGHFPISESFKISIATRGAIADMILINVFPWLVVSFPVSFCYDRGNRH